MSYTPFTTKPCPKCGKQSVINLWNTDYERYVAGALIQDAFPDLLQPMREMIQSGTHPQCWLEIFGENNGE
jgi:hypothetical protein